MDYRYFVNIDHCISDVQYGFFFYKNQSNMHNRLKVFSSSLGKEGSFSDHSKEIRKHLDQNPYNIDKYQIIFAVRSYYHSDYMAEWQRTLLSRMIDIDYNLREAGVIDSSGFSVKCALNIFAIYKLENVELGQVNDTNYWNTRLISEWNTLLRLIGIDVLTSDVITYKVIASAWENYQKTNSVSLSLKAFFSELLKRSNEDAICNFVAYAIEHYMKRFNIFELFIDSRSISQEQNAFFKIIDYVYTELDESSDSFSENCINTWNKIKGNQDIDIKYSLMLRSYKARLLDYENILSLKNEQSDQSKTISINLPPDNAIYDSDSVFENENNLKQRLVNPSKIFSKFRKSLVKKAGLLSSWEDTYDDLLRFAVEINKCLKDYEVSLRRKYTCILKVRDESEEFDISDKLDDIDLKSLREDLVSKRKTVMTNLENSQIAPRILYGDQLNLESEIRQLNDNVTFYIDCMLSVKYREFIILCLTLLSVISILYAFLQHNVWFSANSIFAAAYLFITFALMQIFWIAPKIHYGKLISDCLDESQAKIDVYKQNYEANAKKLSKYVNYSNQLDFVESYIQRIDLKLYKNRKSSDINRYYSQETRKILNAIDSFDGLINRYENLQEAETNDKEIKYPEIDADGDVEEITNCEIFWPQL